MFKKKVLVPYLFTFLSFHIIISRMGRRSMMTSSLFFCGIILVSAALVPKDDDLQWIKVALSSAAKLFNSVAHDLTFIQVACVFYPLQGSIFLTLALIKLCREQNCFLQMCEPQLMG